MEALKQLFLKETCLPSLGPCMIIFAIPLLLPGLTLTLVALWDETGYSKFSALHVLGIVLLVFSGLLLMMGLVLNFTVTKKAKRRISPQEDEEEGDSVSRSPSTPDWEVLGHVHSTHGTRTVTTDPRSLSDDKEPAALDPEHASPGGRGAGGKTWPATLPPLQPASVPSGREPINGRVPALAITSAPSRTWQEGRRNDKASADSGDKLLRVGEGRDEQRRGSCNYMLTDSEEEQLEAIRYAAVAAELMRKSDGRMRTMSALSSTASSSNEHSSEETSDVERDPHHLDSRQQQSSGLPEPDHRTVGSDHRPVTSSQELTSRTSPDQSAVCLSSVEDQPSSGVSARHRQTQNSDHEDSDDGGVPFFVTRQKAAEPIQREHAADFDTEHPTESQTVTHQPALLQEHSSSSMFTESPSHGTYSLKSFVSEEPAVKTSPDELSVTEDDVFRSSPGVLAAGSPAERTRSVSPVPLRKTTSDGLKEDVEHSFTVLGGRSGHSSQSSPEKRSRTGSLLDSKSEDDSRRSKDRKKKRKKKKKRRERGKAEKEGLPGGGGGVEGAEREAHSTGGQEASPDHHHPSLLRSARSLQNHPEHHVHWPDDDDDDDDVPMARLEAVE